MNPEQHDTDQRCWRTYFIVSVILSALILIAGGTIAFITIKLERGKALMAAHYAGEDRHIATLEMANTAKLKEFAAKQQEKLLKAYKRIAELEAKVDEK